MKEDIFNPMNEYKDRKNIPIKETDRYEDGVSLDENSKEKDPVDDSYKTYGEELEAEIKDEPILDEVNKKDEKIGLEIDKKAGVTHVNVVDFKDDIEEIDEGLDVEGNYNDKDFINLKEMIDGQDSKIGIKRGKGKDNLKTRSEEGKKRDERSKIRKFLGKDY